MTLWAKVPTSKCSPEQDSKTLTPKAPPQLGSNGGNGIEERNGIRSEKKAEKQATSNCKTRTQRPGA